MLLRHRLPAHLEYMGLKRITMQDKLCLTSQTWKAAHKVSYAPADGCTLSWQEHNETFRLDFIQLSMSLNRYCPQERDTF